MPDAREDCPSCRQRPHTAVVATRGQSLGGGAYQSREG